MKRLLAATTFLVATLMLASATQATTILSTSMGFGVNGVTCFTLNTSTKPVEVDSVRFVFTDGSSVSLTQQASTCTYPGLVSPGQACRDSTDIGINHDSVRCVIVTKGNAKSIRGSMSLFDNSGAQSILETR
jgi:hypothetical protein